MDNTSPLFALPPDLWESHIFTNKLEKKQIFLKRYSWIQSLEFGWKK